MYGACELKDQTYKKTRTLHFSEKKTENATRPKTRVTDRSQNLRSRVCCVFGCALAPS